MTPQQYQRVREIAIDCDPDSIAYAAHSDGLKQTLSVKENLEFWASVFAAGSIDQAVSAFQLESLLHRPAGALSAGQKRRLGLARLLVTGRPVWILDEPYTAVDKQGIANLEAVFKDHVDRGGLVIFTSHQTPNLPNLKCVNLLNFAPGAIREVAGG